MTRKFNKEQFIKRFVEIMRMNFNRRSGLGAVISISDVAKATLRELDFKISANRYLVQEAIDEWWESLPSEKERPFMKYLFGGLCGLCSTRSARWLSLQGSTGDLIMWYRYGVREE